MKNLLSAGFSIQITTQNITGYRNPLLWTALSPPVGSSVGQQGGAHAGAAGTCCSCSPLPGWAPVPSLAPFPGSYQQKCTCRSQRSCKTFLPQPREGCRLCYSMYLYSPVLTSNSDRDLVSTAHFFIAVSNPEGTVEMWPCCLFVMICEQTPGFSGVLLLLCITHQMVWIKILQMMNSSWILHITSKACFSEFALYKWSLVHIFCCWFSSPVCRAPNPQAASRIITSTCVVWVPLQIHMGISTACCCCTQKVSGKWA